MNLEALIRDQNPQWFIPKYSSPEANWYKRQPYYQNVIATLKLHLIITLSGLRRVGKSTLLKQLINHLLTRHQPQNILYFSFDESLVKNEPETLRQILETYASYLFSKPATLIDQPVFILLDEIQTIPSWQNVLKTYYDTNPHMTFIVSGSSSLFVSRSATESLAGRTKEIIIPPLTFLEYLELHPQVSQEIKNLDFSSDKLSKYARFFPDQLKFHFEKYLRFGQFPQVIQEAFSEPDTQEYLKTIENKIIEFDLPKSYPIQRPDILHLIFSHFKNTSGNLLLYENLANDLGVDTRTTIKYIDWLKTAFLIHICLNQTKSLTKAARTAKKIYLTSTNFSSTTTLGNLVETYIFNVLRQFELPIEFFRFQTQEVDFVITTKTSHKIPWEVKYQSQIKQRDIKSLLSFAKHHKSPQAFLITKNKSSPPEKIGLTYLCQIQASQLELNIPKLSKVFNI